MAPGLTSIPSIAGLWLMPRLSQLEAGDPKLRVVLDIDIRQADLADEGIDLSIRCGRGKIPGRISTQLFEGTVFPSQHPPLRPVSARATPQGCWSFR